MADENTTQNGNDTVDYEKLAKMLERPSLGMKLVEKVSDFKDWFFDCEDGSIMWLIKRICSWIKTFFEAVGEAVTTRLMDTGDDEQ